MVSFPLQLPPQIGAGSAHILLRLLLPFWQVTEQAPHLPHSVQPPDSERGEMGVISELRFSVVGIHTIHCHIKDERLFCSKRHILCFRFHVGLFILHVLMCALCASLTLAFVLGSESRGSNAVCGRVITPVLDP